MVDILAILLVIIAVAFLLSVAYLVKIDDQQIKELEDAIDHGEPLTLREIVMLEQNGGFGSDPKRYDQYVAMVWTKDNIPYFQELLDRKGYDYEARANEHN